METRGTLFPLVVVPLLALLLVLGLFAVSSVISESEASVRSHIVWAAWYLGYAAAGLAGLFVLQGVWRGLFRRER